MKKEKEEASVGNGTLYRKSRESERDKRYSGRRGGKEMERGEGG